MAWTPEERAAIVAKSRAEIDRALAQASGEPEKPSTTAYFKEQEALAAAAALASPPQVETQVYPLETIPDAILAELATQQVSEKAVANEELPEPAEHELGVKEGSIPHVHPAHPTADNAVSPDETAPRTELKNMIARELFGMRPLTPRLLDNHPLVKLYTQFGPEIERRTDVFIEAFHAQHFEDDDLIGAFLHKQGHGTPIDLMGVYSYLVKHLPPEEPNPAMLDEAETLAQRLRQANTPATDAVEAFKLALRQEAMSKQKAK